MTEDTNVEQGGGVCGKRQKDTTFEIKNFY